MNHNEHGESDASARNVNNFLALISLCATKPVMTTTAPSLPLGVALPSDVERARELLAELQEQAEQEAAAEALLRERQADADAVI